MALLTDRSYDFGLDAEMTPIDDPRRQAPAPVGYRPTGDGSPLNFGLREDWRNLQGFARDNPAAMMRLGAGIMQGETAAALAQFGEHAQAARELHHHKQRRNRTMDFLRANHPDLAGMVDAGLPVAEAWRRVLTGWRPAEPDAMPIDDGPDSPDPGHWQRGTDPSREGQLLRAGPQEDHPGSLDTGMTNQSPAGNQPEFGESDGVMLYRPSTLEAFEALPSGVLYLDPGDNRVYRKI